LPRVPSSLSFPVLTALKEGVLSKLSPRHKQILAIASIALALLAATYFATKRCFFTATPNVESKPLDEQDRIPGEASAKLKTSRLPG
jgi:hypothetical protein